MPAVETKELGTLIVVVGKARNLVNKSRFGKQDPFCTIAVAEDKQRTKPIKRGGQHPEWDEEFRFTISEDLDDVLVRSESQPDSLNSSLNGAPAPLPKDTPAGVITSAALANKSRKGPLGKKGGKSLRVACYADDAKEPELIGEAVVKIDEVLKKGEVDEWYEFLYKEKYSGEVYLELTFYSNDVPPVRRNVPRPPVHNYGGAATFQPSPSGSLSSAASRNRLAGGTMTSSGSVSGMSLYIPPYMQQGRAPSPTPQMPPSNSFAELGLPPGHRPGHQPLQSNQPTYPPSQPSTLSVQSIHSSSSIDALTRPMSSMSIGQSYPTQPAGASNTPAPAPPQHTGHGYGSHRHSLGGGSSDAPWSSMLPQAQPPPAPTPHPRPMSTSDAMPWEQAQRLEHERLVAGATPLLRPVSGQGQIPQQQYYTPHHRQSFSSIDHRVPSPIPEALRPGPPPSNSHHVPIRSHSLSQTLPAPINPAGYPAQSPALVPPPHSNSAPPISPSTSTYYQQPTSSFSTLTQPTADPNRAPSPGPGYHQSQQQMQTGLYNDPSGQQSTQSGYYSPYQTPSRNDTYPPQPAGQGYQQTSVSAQPWSSSHPQSSGPSYQATPAQTFPSYGYNQNSNSPPRPPTAAPAPPPANEGGYVPWYQQTQSAAQTQSAPVQNQHRAQDYGQLPQQTYTHPPPERYTTPLPPPVPQARPQAAGYYPSDELYLQQQQQQQQQQQPPRQGAVTPTPQAPWQSHQNRLSYDQQASFDAQRQQAFSPLAPSNHSPAAPQQPGYQGVPPPSPPRQPSWQQTQQYAPPPSQTPYQQYAQQPPPPPPPQNSHYQPPTPQPPQTDYRASSPHPSYNDYGRAPSPQPPAPYGQSAQQPQYSQAPTTQAYGRSPSPAPPAQTYQPPYPAQSDTWQMQGQGQLPPSAQLAPPVQSASPLAVDLGCTPSPTPSASGSTAKTNWRSYMAGLNTNVGPGANGPDPARTPSPQPPPKDGPAQGHGQGQGQWYTPPPSLPSSIAPPEGWKSTLPAQRDGHQWRG